MVSDHHTRHTSSLLSSYLHLGLSAIYAEVKSELITTHHRSFLALILVQLAVTTDCNSAWLCLSDCDWFLPRLWLWFAHTQDRIFHTKMSSPSSADLIGVWVRIRWASQKAFPPSLFIARSHTLLCCSIFCPQKKLSRLSVGHVTGKPITTRAPYSPLLQSRTILF